MVLTCYGKIAPITSLNRRRSASSPKLNILHTFGVGRRISPGLVNLPMAKRKGGGKERGARAPSGDRS